MNVRTNFVFLVRMMNEATRVITISSLMITLLFVANPYRSVAQCTVDTYPYTEDFEDGSQWTAISGLNSTGDQLANCWSRSPQNDGSNYAWVVKLNFTQSSNTGPDLDPEDGNFIYTESSNGNSNDQAFINAPEFDLSGLTSPRMKVSYHMYGSSMGTLSVQVKNVSSTSYNTEFSISGQQQFSSFDDFDQAIIDLSSYAGKTVNIRFVGQKGGSFNSDMAIDDIIVEEAPECLAPSSISNTSVSTTSANFTWSSVAEAANGYEYVVMPDGNAPDPSSAVDTGTITSGLSVSASGLTEQTGYDFYLRSNCGGNVSPWSNKIDFTTNCSSFSAPFQEDFSSSSSTEDCWSVINNNDDGDVWDMDYSFNSLVGDEVAMIYTFLNSGDNDDYLISPTFELSGNERLRFSYRVQSEFIPNYFEVKLSTNGANVNDLNTTLLSLNNINNTTYQQATIDLSAYSGQVNIAFHKPSGGQNGSRLFIDQVILETIPDCFTPDNLTVANTTSSSAELNWDADATATNGYDWVIMDSGDDPDTDTPVDSANAVTGTNVTSNALSPSTVYDAYVRSNCGNGDLSAWSLKKSFSTTPINDDACNATPLTVGAISNGDDFSNVGATAQPNEPNNGLNGGVNGSVWFSFVAPDNGSVQIATKSGTLANTEIAVYSVTDCSDFSTYSQLSFNQDSSPTNLTSFISLRNLNAGQTYYVQVDQWATVNSGTFGIDARNIYIYDGSSWTPQVPGGNTNVDNDIIIEAGTANIDASTTANNVQVEAGAVLDINANLTTNSITFKSDNSGTAQLANAEDNTITGDITVERFIPVQTEDTRAYRFLTSSVDSNASIFDNWQEGGNSPAGYGTHITGNNDGTNGVDQTISGNPSMYTFDNSFTGNQSNAWNAITDTKAKNLSAGEAYRIFIRGDRNYNLDAVPGDPDFGPNSDVTLRATGSLAMGNQNETLSDVGGYYNMIGNPYQANININSLTGTNLNTNFYWVWDPNMSQRGAYVAVPLPTGVPAGTSDANQFVQPGQSFFVQTLNDGAADLTFTESAKDVAALPTDVFSDNNPTSINLLLYTDQALNNDDSEADALGINFSPNGNNAVDQMDAGKMGNPDENLARLNNGEYLSIENRAMPVDGESLALFTNGYTGSDYTFVANVSNLPDDVDAFLIDHYTGNQTLLSDGANQISFTVDASTPGSIATDRFSVDFEVETFGIDDQDDLADFRVYPNPVEDENITVQAPSFSGEAKVNLYNMIGQKVMTTEANFQSNEVELNIGSHQAGVYFLEITQDGASVKQRLIIK